MASSRHPPKAHNARKGSPVAALRVARGWTQAELAQRAGVNVSTVSRCERIVGSNHQMFKLRQMAAALDVTVWELIPSDPVKRRRP